MKTRLRQHYKQIRSSLSPQEVAAHSQEVAQQLFSSILWQQATTIMLYLSFQQEIITDGLFQQGWQEGKTMAIPICNPADHTMTLTRLTSLAQLQLNQYGIRELPAEQQQPIAPDAIELSLIPGLAFDLQGNRLGFGAGYYDRYLPQLKHDVPKLALAHQCQLHPATLPTDCHDLPMDYILTEQQLYHIRPQP